MSKTFQAQRLDVAAFVRASGLLQGQRPLAECERLAQETQGEVAGVQVDWRVQGGERAAGDGSVRPSLHVQAHATLPLTCQRCLEPVAVPLAVNQHVLFAPDEDAAAALDDVSEDDVLALTAALDVHELIEDELLMALPLVPHHADCAEPVRVSVQGDDYAAAQAERPHPFAALAQLKGRKLQ